MFAPACLLNFASFMVESAKTFQAHLRRSLPNTIRHRVVGLPHSFSTSTADIASSKGWKFIPLNPSRPFRNLGKVKGDTRSVEGYRKYCPPDSSQWATFVVEIPQGCVYSKRGYVFDQSGCLLSDICNLPPSGSHHDNPIFRKEIVATKRISAKGKIAVLATTGTDIYYHALIDLVPRIGLLIDAGYKLDQLDGIVIPKRRPAALDEILRKLDIPSHKLIESARSTLIEAECLVVPSLAHERMRPSYEASQFLQNAVRPLLLEDQELPNPTSADRIYIKRRGRRRILNEDVVEPVIQRYGFTTVIAENLTFSQQVSLFKNSKFVIGVHGAGLANITFGEPDCHVFEIAPSDFDRFCYWDLAQALGQKLTRIPAIEVESGKRSVKRKASRRNLNVSPDVLDSILTEQMGKA